MEHSRHVLPFWTIFCLFNNRRQQNFENIKKTGDIIILQRSTKNHDHMLHCPWDMACELWDMAFWAIFCPFTFLMAQKIKIFIKWNKTAWDFIIYHMCIKNFDHMMYSSWDMVHNEQMDWTDRTNRWKTWHIEVGAPPKNEYGAPPSIYTTCNVIFTSTKSCPCQNLKIFQCNDIIKSRSTLQWNGSLVTINWFLRSLSWPRIFLTTSSFM